jgi:membrane-associated protease RseP (regulator of RpoE activity)
MNVSAGWQFRVLNFPVRVHVSFFLIALLLGLRIGNLLYLTLWVLIVFVSVLLHELGHAVTSEYYGRAPRIELYSMGGRTISTRYSLLSYPKEILVSFSGPLAGFLLGGLLFAVYHLLGPLQSDLLNFVIGQLLWVNIGWGILNLIPILPLDGGNIMRNLYHWFKNPYDERTPLKISIGFGIVAVIAAVALLGPGGLYLALLLGWLTLNNYMALRQGYSADSIL